MAQEAAQIVAGGLLVGVVACLLGGLVLVNFIKEQGAQAKPNLAHTEEKVHD